MVRITFTNTKRVKFDGQGSQFVRWQPNRLRYAERRKEQKVSRTYRQGKKDYRPSERMIAQRLQVQERFNGAVRPLQVALNAAYEITSHSPEQKQPGQYRTLQVAMDALDGKGCCVLVTRLCARIVEDTGQSPRPAYAAARLADQRPDVRGQRNRVSNATLIQRLWGEHGLATDDLGKCGVAYPRYDPRNPHRIVGIGYRFGHETLRAMVPKLQDMGKTEAADALAAKLAERDEKFALRNGGQRTAAVPDGVNEG